jgi:uncharacterized protein YjiS (DUF1127 family)
MAERIRLTATTSSAMTLRRALSFAWGRVAGVLRALNHRGEVRRLAELDERALKDIGLTRLDVIGALGEPLHRDPSTVLMIRSVERRSRSRAVGVTRAPAEERASLSDGESGKGGRLSLTTEHASSTRLAV